MIVLTHSLDERRRWTCLATAWLDSSDISSSHLESSARTLSEFLEWKQMRQQTSAQILKSLRPVQTDHFGERTGVPRIHTSALGTFSMVLLRLLVQKTKDQKCFGFFSVPEDGTYKLCFSVGVEFRLQITSFPRAFNEPISSKVPHEERGRVLFACNTFCFRWCQNLCRGRAAKVQFTWWERLRSAFENVLQSDFMSYLSTGGKPIAFACLMRSLQRK